MPPLKKTGGSAVLLRVGVRVIVTVAVDPDCNEIGPQLMLVLDEPPPPQVPVLMVALTLLTGTPVLAKLARIATLLAKSGPLFVRV